MVKHCTGEARVDDVGVRAAKHCKTLHRSTNGRKTKNIKKPVDFHDFRRKVRFSLETATILEEGPFLEERKHANSLRTERIFRIDVRLP